MNEKAIEAALRKQFNSRLHGPEGGVLIFENELPKMAKEIAAALPPLRAREEIARHLQTLDDLFHGLAREYRGYLPDSERGFGTADSRTREMRIEDDTKKFRAAHDALSRTAGQEWRVPEGWQLAPIDPSHIAQSGRHKTTVAAMDWALREIERMRVALELHDKLAQADERDGDDQMWTSCYRQACETTRSALRPLHLNNDKGINDVQLHDQD